MVSAPLTPFQTGFLMGLEAANLRQSIIAPEPFRQGRELGYFNQGVEVAYAVIKVILDASI